MSADDVGLCESLRLYAIRMQEEGDLWLAGTLRGLAHRIESETNVKIDGALSLRDGSFPRLFVTTPDGVRREIRRIEFMERDERGRDKYPAWTSGAP